jgi:hypothetical protein
MRSKTSRKLAQLTGLLALLPALVLAGCSAGDIRDDEGTLVSAGFWSVFDLRPGDCITDDIPAYDDMVPLVPCDEPHSQEVFAVIAFPDGPPEQSYPGAGALASFGDIACSTALLEDFNLQISDGVAFSYLLPTEEGWQEKNDSLIVCVLVFADGQAVGSVVSGSADLRSAG